MIQIFCPTCGRKLGEIVAGHSIVRHRGREWIGHVEAIRCECCGTTWEGPVLQVESDGPMGQGRVGKPEGTAEAR